MEDCCAVCAEPLEWVALGRCGHKDACSQCVARLRFVLKDNRCVICQQLMQLVFVTKYLGSFTPNLSASEYDELQAGSQQTSYCHLRSIDAFFDDKGHFDHIRKLCSYTHPVLTGGWDAIANNGQASPYKSLGALRRALQQQHQLNFCDLCLEGRKVFIPEQILYTKPDLARHHRIGDAEGVLAESGFKGHPLCRFCNRRFFGETELYFHMQQTHEQCHLCKRAHPNKFEYFNTYNELEEHFRHEHFLCGHPSCLEKKFVVFSSEHELKQHNAREHAGSMSRAERRQALTIPINFQFSQRAVEPSRGRGRQGARTRVPESSQLATALQASVDSAQRERQRSEATSQQQNQGPGQRVLEDAEFPSMGGTSAAPFTAHGYAASAAGRTTPSAEEFPALPGTSKSAKRRAKAKEQERTRTLAERVGRPGEVRVLNSGRAPNPPASSREEAFPALSHSSSAPQLADLRAPTAAAQWQAPSQQPRPPAPAQARGRIPALNDFPSLPGFEAGPRRAAPPAAVSKPSAANRGSGRGPDDFPALGGAQAPAPGPAATTEAAVLRDENGAGPSGRKISEGLKAANKALIEKIKKQLDQKKFIAFRSEASKFLNGGIDAATYHQQVVGLGLGALIPEMAILLPDPVKRAELLSVHEVQPSGSGRSQAAQGAAAALRNAKTQSSWQCSVCTLINEPRAGTCEACHAKRPMNDLAMLSRASASAKSSAAVEESAQKAGGKQKKVPKFERLRLTSGGRDPSVQEEASRRTIPSNAWTHRHNLTGTERPAQPIATWGGKQSENLRNGPQNAWGAD